MADDSDDLDEALEETFPASDPPANTVETGIGVNGAPLVEETGMGTESAEITGTESAETTGTESTETTDSHRETE